jgi:hypothetical protein
VNASIKAKTDKDRWGIEDIWDFAEDGYGDCEDYQLVKRKRPVEAGFSRRALRMTVMNITKAHFALLNDEIARLTTLRGELETVVACDNRLVSECRIIEVLADHGECQHHHY